MRIQMDGRGGCCTTRYAGNMSKVDYIMLRFRPIAPKPAIDGGGSSPGGGKYGSAADKDGSDVRCKTSRGKKRFSKENSGFTRGCNRRRRLDKFDGKGGATAATTLSLLPETPDGMMCPDLKLSSVEQKWHEPFWLNFSGGVAAPPPLYHATEMVRKTVVSSCVIVERVTDAWIDGYGLGGTNKERKMHLEKDTCPGFISDSLGRVTWTNMAYWKMVGDSIPAGGGSPEKKGDYTNMDMMVRLVMKERPMLTYSAFTCRVRLQYTFHNRGGSSVTVPCDVWKMDGGGFAWRLDVKAALCL